MRRENRKVFVGYYFTLMQLKPQAKLDNDAQMLKHYQIIIIIGKIPVRVDELGVDYLTVVGHKFYGPRIGALFVRDLGKPGSEIPLHPMFFGGGQERSFRPGTENTPVFN